MNNCPVCNDENRSHWKLFAIMVEWVMGTRDVFSVTHWVCAEHISYHVNKFNSNDNTVALTYERVR